jgi:ankyrin repeat protein
VVASAVHSEMAALAALQLLLDHPKCNLEQRDSQGYTPLMLAVLP